MLYHAPARRADRSAGLSGFSGIGRRIDFGLIRRSWDRRTSALRCKRVDVRSPIRQGMLDQMPDDRTSRALDRPTWEGADPDMVFTMPRDAGKPMWKL